MLFQIINRDNLKLRIIEKLCTKAALRKLIKPTFPLSYFDWFVVERDLSLPNETQATECMDVARQLCGE